MNNHTFVIPAYKDSPYLEACILSLIDQSVKSIIIITTSTHSEYIKQTAKKYSIQVMINNSTNKGIAEDWNFALAQANTQYVTIAHQDDIYNPEFAEKVVQKLSCYIKSLIVFTDYSELLNDTIRKNSLNLVVKRLLLFPFFLKSTIGIKLFKKTPLVFGNPICCPSVTYNLKNLSGFSFSSDYSYNLDWLAWYQLSNKKGKFVFIKRKLMKHRIHEGSETSKQLKTDGRKNEERKIFEILWGKYIGRFISYIYSLGHKGNII